ncbi:MAG: nucleotidyltransferase family protein [Planktomarina sp.]
MDKLTRPFNGSSLIRRAAVATHAMPGETWVALPSLDHPRAAQLDELDIKIKCFQSSNEGISGTLRAAVAALPMDTTHICVTLADLPGLSAAHFTAFNQAISDHPTADILRGRTAQGRPAHPTVFARSTFESFADLSGDDGAKPLFQNPAFNVQYIELTGPHVGIDLDTPQDWDAFQQG